MNDRARIFDDLGHNLDAPRTDARAVTHDATRRPASAPRAGDYATIRCRDLASSALRNLARDCPNAARLWLYSNALHRHPRGRREPDPLVLPIRQIASDLGMRDTAASEAMARLLALRWITRTREAIRPDTMGGAGKGRAAEYLLDTRRPHADRGKGKRGHMRRRDTDPDPWGSITCDCARLAWLAAHLSPAALRIWIAAAATDRQGSKSPRHGAPIADAIPLRPADLARDLGMPESSARLALRILADLGEATTRGRTYIAAGTLATGRARKMTAAERERERRKRGKHATGEGDPDAR